MMTSQTKTYRLDVCIQIKLVVTYRISCAVYRLTQPTWEWTSSELKDDKIRFDSGFRLQVYKSLKQPPTRSRWKIDP